MVGAMDTLVSGGLVRHFEDLARRLSVGETRLGYKVAFNAPAVQAELGLPYALAAGMTRRSLLASDVYDLHGSTRYALEPEVAVELGADVSAHDSEDQAAAAVRSMAPAIELVERDRLLSELPEVIAEGVYHRAVRLGPAFAPPDGADVAGMRAEVRYNGAVVADVDAAVGTGSVPRMLLHIARLLERHDQKLCAGDWLILGTLCKPVAAVAGDRFSLFLADQHRVEINLR